jgi:hypothetical protein
MATKRPAKGPAVMQHDITIRQPGLEQALAALVGVLARMADREEQREDRFTGDDALATERLRLEAERNLLARAEHEQRVREWELEAAERRQRLTERQAAARGEVANG